MAKATSILPIGQALPEKAAVERRDVLIFEFDHGAGLTLDDMMRHLLCTGITGSGKTTSVGAPLLKGMLSTGCGAFIADHKGNLRTTVRKICRILGREQDIIEYGTGPQAIPVNVIEGMPIYGVRNFFSVLMRKVIDSKSGNLDFHEKGVSFCVDVVEMLRFLHEHVAGFPKASMSLVAEDLMDEDHAFALWDYFKRHVFDKSNDGHFDLLRRVEAGPFHILSKGKKAAIGSSRVDQVAYQFAMIRLTMNRFLESPVVRRNFSANTNGIDFADALDKRKIILFRLDPGLGPVGEDLCRMLIEAWYGAIIARGTELAVPTLTFMDEFQSICNLSNSAFSDRRFIAESREFKASVAILTQNIAGLLGAADEADVLSMIHNLNSKIMFYNGDPATQRVLDGFPDADLARLERGQAFVVRFDSDKGKHIDGIESVNKAHDAIKKELDAISIDELSLEQPEIPEQPRLQAVLRMLSGKEESKPVGQGSCMGASSGPSRELQIVGEIMEKEGWAAKDYNVSDIRYRWPQYFAAGAKIFVPRGWYRHLDRVFQAFSETCLPLQITSLDSGNHPLTVECDESTSVMAKNLIRNFVHDISHVCPVCGRWVENTGSYSQLSMCPVCLVTFRLRGQDADKEGVSSQIRLKTGVETYKM